MVGVGPPLNSSGPRSGLTLIMSLAIRPMAALLTISIRLLPSETTAPKRSGAAVGASGAHAVAGDDRVVERGRARLDVEATAIASHGSPRSCY